MGKKKIEHTANFIISNFLLSKRRTKKVYKKLNASVMGAARYICDSIDLNFSKRKSLTTIIYQSQLAKFLCCTLKTVRAIIKKLIHFKIFNYDEKLHKFSLGALLRAWVKFTPAIEVGKNYPSDRSGYFLPLSKSSNITNKKPSPNENQKLSPLADVSKQSTSYGVIIETPEESARKFEEQMKYLKATN